MAKVWATLPVMAQDALVLAALLLPGLLVGVVVTWGMRPWPLARALLRRHSGASVVFVVLIGASIALGIGLTAQERALRQGGARAAAPFDLVLGAPGSEVTLVLAAVYLQPTDLPLVSGAVWADVASDPDVDLAAPLAFGDSVGGAPVVGTTAAFVGHLSPALAEGRIFAAHHEAVAGAHATAAMGESVAPAHGLGEAAEHDAHGDLSYKVVGRMAPTGSPWDSAFLVPIEAVWEVHGLASGHAPRAEAQIGPPFDPATFPGVPAIVLRSDDLAATYALKDRYSRADVMGVFPGTVLSGLFTLLRDVREAMSAMAIATQGLVVVAVLAGLALLVQIFARSLAMLRALGAPRRFVLAVVWCHAATLVMIGAALGLVLGWVAAGVLSQLVTARTGVLVSARPGWVEANLVAGFCSLAVALALVPALLAGRRPVIDDLRS